jgi:hypothetical protein
MSKAIEILKVIREALEKHPEFGELTTTLYDPYKLDNKPSIGILEKTDKGDVLRFNICVDDNKFGSAFV